MAVPLESKQHEPKSDTDVTRTAFFLSQNADQDTIHLVNGFIRRLSTYLPSENVNIAPLVIHLCIAYCSFAEYFTEIGDNIILDKIEQTIVSTTDETTAYGNIVIDGKVDMKYEWWIKIIKKVTFVAIGIDSSNKKHANSNFSMASINKYCFYSMGSNKYLYSNDGYSDSHYTDDTLSDGDLILMQLDTKNKTLQYSVNDNFRGKAYDVIFKVSANDVRFMNESSQIEYHLALYCQKKDGCMQLLDFKQHRL